MKRLLNCAFVIIALLIAATAALRSHSSARSVSTTSAVRPDAPDAAAREFAATAAPKPMPEVRKPVRYEAIIRIGSGTAPTDEAGNPFLASSTGC